MSIVTLGVTPDRHGPRAPRGIRTVWCGSMLRVGTRPLRVVAGTWRPGACSVGRTCADLNLDGAGSRSVLTHERPTQGPPPSEHELPLRHAGKWPCWSVQHTRLGPHGGSHVAPPASGVASGEASATTSGATSSAVSFASAASPPDASSTRSSAASAWLCGTASLDEHALSAARSAERGCRDVRMFMISPEEQRRSWTQHLAGSRKKRAFARVVSRSPRAPERNACAARVRA